MSVIRVKSAFTLRRDTAANWSAKNPILREGEEGYETDTGRRKIGDGTTEWNNLKYDSGIVDQTYNPDSENAQSGKAVAEAVSDKQDSLVSGTNIKTINNQSILGSGNITIEGGSDVEVDQNYNPESENAQSGKAVAEAISQGQYEKVVDITLEELSTPILNLDSKIDVMCVIDYPGEDESRNNFFWPSSNISPLGNFFSASVGNKKAMVTLTMSVYGDFFITGCSINNGADNNTSNWWQKSLPVKSGETAIRTLKLANGWPAGTRVVVYAR